MTASARWPLRLAMGFLAAAALFALALLPVAPARAALIIVTNTNDSGPGSLRQAIADAAPQTGIIIDNSLAGQTINLQTALIVDKQMSIEGPGAPAARVKLTTQGRDSIMIISALTNIHDLDFNNGAAENGGAIQITNYTQLSNTTISNSHASGDGGGIWVAPHASFILDDALVLDNTAGGDGAGIFAGDTSVIDMSNVNFTGNNATGRGGGIFADTVSTVEVQSGSVIGNVAASGGGIYSDGNIGYYGTIASNGATADGGGIYLNSGLFNLNLGTLGSNTANRGGGVFAQPGTELDLIFSTISNNGAPQGGGIYRAGGLLDTRASIIGDQQLGADCVGEPGSTIASGGYNIDSDNSCGLVNPTDIPAGHPNLGPMTFTSPGTTQTMTPMQGSDAINRIPLSVFECDSHLQRDQNGVTRPLGPSCDIGAVEAPSATSGRKWGDNLCDGAFDLGDALASLDLIGGVPWEHGEDCLSVGSYISIHGVFEIGQWGDLNCDGSLNGVDIVLSLRAAIALEAQQFPDCPRIGDMPNVTS